MAQAAAMEGGSEYQVVMVLDAYSGQEEINSYFLLTEYRPLLHLL
jgi:hypothetical protein